MLRNLTTRLYHSITIEPKIFLTTRQRTLRQIKKSLQQIINNYHSMILLCKTLQIFPSYFTHNHLQKMLNSQYIEEYVDYVIGNQDAKDQPIQDKQLKHALTMLKLMKPTQRRILEVYINFIKRTEDLVANENIMEIFDIRNPENWFRSKQSGERKFVYHHGPTNSGKTYSAINELKNLKPDQKGVYMAPLRLLAWQTQQKLGKCNLVTGQEKDYQSSNITSCTIQANKLTQFYDVAIVDQIQMIGDTHRGWSWTSAVLGLKSNKIHLCGDERALHLISRLIQKSGGTLEQKKYTRLSKLHFINRLFKLSDLRPGDCIIDFQSRLLYKLRQQINQAKGTKESPTKTAIIYGKMPPGCRKDQANKFNNGQLPYLVASDAIGMGLNLKIRRIIFANLVKLSNEGTMRQLEDHQIRQIAGRAGRGLGHGYVQCIDAKIRQKVKYALRNVNITIQQNLTLQQQAQENNQSAVDVSQSKPQSLTNLVSTPIPDPQTEVYDTYLGRYLKQDQMIIKRAGIFFPPIIIERIKIKMQRMLNRPLKISQTIILIIQLSKENRELYFVEHNGQLLELSNQLQKLELPFDIHFLFAQMPVPNSSTKFKQVLINYAKQYKYAGEVKLPDDLIQDYEKNFEAFKTLTQINHLQNYYFIAESYTWLWNHLELYFPYNGLALKIKDAICNKMNQILKQPGQKNRGQAVLKNREERGIVLQNKKIKISKTTVK